MRGLNIALGVLLLIVVGAAGIGIVTTFTGDSGDGWQYDDYRPAGDAVSASGALELIVTDSGAEMLHASDVGRATIDYGTHTEVVQVQPARLDVYLITGQSNSTHTRFDPDLASPLPAPGTAYAWMYASGQYGDLHGGSPAMRPMVSPDGEALTGNKAPAFAATANEITGNKTYWICGGLSGKSVGYFDPWGSAGWMYMKGLVADAMGAIDPKLYDVRTVCYMWIQGEADDDMAVDRYQKLFLRMHEAIIGGELGWEFSHCYISLVTTADGGNAREAQLMLAEEYPETITIATEVADTFTVANGLMSEDGLHYSQLGCNIIGVDLGRACGEYAKDTGGKELDLSLMNLLPVMVGLATAMCCLWFMLPYIRGRD